MRLSDAMRNAWIRPRLPRPTIRFRLSLLYGGLFLVSGALLLALTYGLFSAATGTPQVYLAPNGEIRVDFNGFAGFVADTQPEPDAISRPVGIETLPEPTQLQSLVAQQHAAELTQLLVWSGVALTVMAVASMAIGWVIAGRVLRPLRMMTGDVRRISATSLDRRLELPGPDDELKDLGATFNDLLGRLQRSFDAQRQFVANASHELRTPLARQRTLLQVAITDPDATVDTLRAAGGRVLVASRQQEALVDALLTLARSERAVERQEVIDLAAIARGVLKARSAELGRIGLRVDARLEPAVTSGDPRLIERLVANLVENAERYNVAQGRIGITTATRNGSAKLRIVNDGPRIDPDDVDRLFEPFERLGPGRTGYGEGWGLGLSIVRAVAVAHGGVVTGRSQPEGGLAIEASFPEVTRTETFQLSPIEQTRTKGLAK
jgi:signal transduction histidine kinase